MKDRLLKYVDICISVDEESAQVRILYYELLIDPLHEHDRISTFLGTLSGDVHESHLRGPSQMYILTYDVGCHLCYLPDRFSYRRNMS